jgi:hypothetical protein
MFNAAANESTGEWYLGVYCRKCQAPIPVFQDPGRGTAITAGSGKLTVACTRCGRKAQYAAREVISFLVYADRAAPADPAPVNDDHPIERGTLMSESEPVLDLGPYEIPDVEPEDALEFELELELDPEDTLELDELEPEAAPASEAEPAEADSAPMPEPEIILELGPYEVSDPEPEPDASVEAASAETAELTTGEPVADAAPATGPSFGEKVASETPAAETPVGDDHIIEPPVPVSEPVPELAPQPSAESKQVIGADDVEPVRPPELDAASELQAFFESSPAPETAPVETPPDTEPEKTAEAAPGEIPASEAPGHESAIEQDIPRAELVPQAPEPTPALEGEQAPAVDAESTRQPDLDAALDLEAFFEASPLPEFPEPTADTAAEPEPALEHAPNETPEAEPAPAIELEPIPDVDVEPIGQPELDPSRELEAFFEASSVAESAPTADTSENAEPQLSEAFAREALVSRAPEIEAPTADIVPVVPAPVETAPPSPPPAPTPAPPKPIAVIYRERWADAAARPQIIRELRPLIHGLKARAEAQRYDVLVRVTDLFTDYLVEVAPERQSGVAIEQYIFAVFALSERGRLQGTDRMGEEMAATLRALNRHAGLYTHR